MLALVSVITILSAVFIYTSLNNADDWAGRQTIEFRDSLKDKYKVLIETVAGNLSVGGLAPEQIIKIRKKYPEIKSIKMLTENKKGEYIEFSVRGLTFSHQTDKANSKGHSPDKKDELIDGHADSRDKSLSYGSKSENSESSSESVDKGLLSLSQLKDLKAGKGSTSFEGEIAGHGGSHDVMTDKQFLKIVEPIHLPDHSGPKPEFKNGALVADISLVEPLKEIHIKHLETSGHFIQISLIAGVLSTLLALLVGGFIARGITQPVKKLMNVAEDVSMGRNVQDIDIKSNDEIGDLADSFQRMVTAVKFLTIKEGDEDESISADS